MEKCCRYIDQLKKVIPKIIEVNEEATGFEVNSLFLYYACVFFCSYNKDYATSRSYCVICNVYNMNLDSGHK